MTKGAVAILLGLVLVVKLSLDQKAPRKSTNIDQSKVQLLTLESHANSIEHHTTTDNNSYSLKSEYFALNDEQIMTSFKELHNDIEVKINDLVKDRHIITNDDKYCAFLVNSMSRAEKEGYISRIKRLYEQASPEKKGYVREMENHVVNPLLDEFSKPLCVDVIVDGQGFASWSTFNTDEPSDIKTNDFGIVLKRHDVVAKASLYSADFERRYGHAIPDKIRKTMENAKAQAQSQMK